MALVTILASALIASVAGQGLVDPPIAGDSVTYLDGTWKLYAAEEPKSVCKFVNNTDYKPKDGTNSGHEVPAATPADCCQACTGDCVVAVWLIEEADGSGACWVKNSDDIAGGSYEHDGRTACVRVSAPPSPAPPTKYSIEGKVPGDLLTDLQMAGLIGDPLYEDNFLNATIWDDNEWTYSTTFPTPKDLDVAAGEELFLIFDGVKMGARMAINGAAIGNSTDQFLRYKFPITEFLNSMDGGDNTLTVVLDKSMDCGGRWMACTGGWDWAPYSTTSSGGAATFSKGIWKSVYLLKVSTAAITGVVPQVMYNGPYPTTKLEDGAHGGFTVGVRVHTYAAAQTSATLTLTGSWGASAKAQVSVPAGEGVVTANIAASASDIKLWWPAGQGAQPLYNVTAALGDSVAATRRIGFRMFALVTGNDTDPAYVKAKADAQGTDSLGMLWRVNGAVVWSKGANMIPMEEMEGRMAANAHAQLVKNAVDGSMNTLRVWGGGMFLPEVWYDTCDELGIMVYHDMQYAQQGHSPNNNPIQDAELRHNIRRLSHHPAIVMWDGCNECRVIMNTPTGIYATFVMTVVSQEDASRPVWPSCPALGWSTGVHALTSMPNGKNLTTPQSSRTIETHGPYQHGSGFPSVNGGNTLESFDANIPINIKSGQTGPQYENVFASEFGSSVYSSFESMSTTLDKAHWGVHAGMPGDTCKGSFTQKCVGPNPMSQRNYVCDNIIDVYFGSEAGDFDKVGEDIFKRHLWQCMVGQALLIKQNIETRRSQNEFGCIVWQFNEIWPTGGWGSIEYGTVGYTKGQVLGGRWKPLQFMYKQSIFADVMATCGGDGTCYVKNDAITPFVGTVQIEALNFASGAKRTLVSKQVSLAAGAGVTEFFTTPLLSNGTKEIMLSTVTTSAGAVLSHHAIPFVAPKHMELPKANVRVTVASTSNADGTVDVTLETDKVAVYVTLTTQAQGNFNDNVLVLAAEETRKLQFVPVEGFVHSELTATTRVEHVASYM
eukprot:m.1031147 g.1031147  ORF g.1031147 m.1031147 type:complete len:1000 (-) comp24121_c0_seq1:1760-4759(-)